MINSIIRFGLIFILLLLLQILVLNNIQFSGYVNPYVYLMFILVLPVELAPWILLLLSFSTGILLDTFSGSPGMHTSSTLVAGFIRPYVLKMISPRDGYESGSDPSIATYGFKWYLIYTSIIVSAHHFVLFFLEVFRFTDFFLTLLRIFLSSLFTTGFILLLDFLRKGK